MKNIFEELNNIDDEISLNNSVHLADIINNAIVVVVDDAKSYDIQTIVDEFAKDYEDEEPVNESFLIEKFNELEHIIVSEQDVRALLLKVAECRYFDVKTDRPKNAEFIAQHNLTEAEIINIVKQLDTQDYCYTLKSKNKFHLGALLHVFISDKEFDLGSRKINNVSIYVKIEYTTEGFVCVVSIHAPMYEDPHPYAKKETN